MAIPGAAAGMGGKMAGNLLASATASLTSFFEPAAMATRYGANQLARNCLPSPTEIVNAYNCGLMNWPRVKVLMSYNGIDLANTMTPIGIPSTSAGRQLAWEQIIQSSETPLPFDVAFRKWQLGELNSAQFTKHLKLSGYGQSTTRDLLKELRQVPSVLEVLDLRNRGKVTADQMRTYLNAQGYTDNREVQLYDSLRFVIPGASDLIHFMVRDVWQQPIVDRFSYDAEFPPEFQTWMERQGLGWKPSEQGYTVAPEQDITWARAYWRAHWQVLSPGQAGDALNRLRPRAPGDAMSRIAGTPAFTAADYDLIMRTQDYPPIVRQWLLGLSYQPLPVRKLQNMYEQGVIDAAELFESFRDWSYSPDNATRLVAMAENTLFQKLTAKARGDLARTTRKGYLDGWLSVENAMAALYRASATSRAAQTRLDSLPDAQLIAEAQARPEIVLEIKTLDMEIQERQASALIAAVRKSALRREITEVQARQIMGSAGLQPDMIERYIQLWNVQLLAIGKNPSASKVMDWLKRGAITQAEATLRLKAFGFNARDSALMVATASQDAAVAQQRQVEKQARTQQQVLRAQAQQLKLAEQNRRRIMADLGKSASRSGILKFMKDGLITADEANIALQQRGILPRDAALWIADTLKEASNATAPKTPTEQTPTSSPGGSGSGS